MRDAQFYSLLYYAEKKKIESIVLAPSHSSRKTESQLSAARPTLTVCLTNIPKLLITTKKKNYLLLSLTSIRI